MSPRNRRWTAVAALTGLLAGALLVPTTASADPQADQPTDPAASAPEVLHNIVYRARVDGVSRGATITYTAQDGQTQTANPTMVPGRVFEANTVLPESGVANLRVSIEWPYSANLHCEILVDDQIVAQADDFIGPRVLPQRDDPNFGSIVCEAPVGGVDNVIPPDPNAVPPAGPEAPPADTNASPAAPVDAPPAA